MFERAGARPAIAGAIAGVMGAIAGAGAVLLLAVGAGRSERSPFAVSPEASAAWAITQELGRPGGLGLALAREPSAARLAPAR